jgi:nitroreductase
MTVTEALNKRTSIRAYLPTAVAKETLLEILAAAERTPSWANSQPWEVFVATGATLERIRGGFAKNYADAVPVTAEIERPAQWTESCQNRTKQLFPDMVRDCGDDVGKFGELNNSLFNAPAVVYLCVDKLLAHWALWDIGAYSQSLMLAAQERGLSTIPAITLTNYPDIVRSELKIPDNLRIALGIAVGYADEANGINNFHSARDDLSSVVRFFE